MGIFNLYLEPTVPEPDIVRAYNQQDENTGEVKVEDMKGVGKAGKV